MDNAAFHKSAAIQQSLRRHNITHKYLVAYSPQLNPIEEFFFDALIPVSELKLKGLD